MGELAANNTGESPTVITPRKVINGSVKGHFRQKLNKSDEYKY